MWADVDGLKKEISMAEKERSKQRVESLLNEIEGCTDEELERFDSIFVERRGRAAAHVVVAPSGTAQPLTPNRIAQNIVRCTCLYGGKHRGQDGPGARKAWTIIGWHGF